jgi:hypothetical protein
MQRGCLSHLTGINTFNNKNYEFFLAKRHLEQSENM